MTSDRSVGAPAPVTAPVATPTRRARRSRPPRQPRPAPEGTAAVVNASAIMVALVCLWTCAQVLLLSGISHDRAQTLLYERYRTQLADLTAPIGPVVPVGDPVALLSIPAIDLEEVVVEGTAAGDLQAGPGHRRDTVLPGQEGVSIVYGRGRSYGGPFARIADLAPGQEIALVTSQGERSLRIIGVRRDGDPLPPLPEPGTARLTLVTAVGDGALSVFTPDTTVYVDAETSDAAPAPARAAGVLPASERAMATDTGALPLLALHLSLLLGLALGVVSARQRFSGSLVWVIASPVAIALAWSTTDVVVRLLPNLV